MWGLCFAFLAFVRCQARLKKLSANAEFFGRLACSGWDKQCMNYSTRPPKHHFHPGQRPQDGFKVISLLIFWSLLLLCLGATMTQFFSTSHDETVPERMFPNPVPPSLNMTSTLESSTKGFVPHNHPENESALLVEACTKVGSVDATPSFPRQRLQKVGAFERMNTYCQCFLSIPCPGHIG